MSDCKKFLVSCPQILLCKCAGDITLHPTPVSTSLSNLCTCVFSCHVINYSGHDVFVVLMLVEAVYLHCLHVVEYHSLGSLLWRCAVLCCIWLLCPCLSCCSFLQLMESCQFLNCFCISLALAHLLFFLLWPAATSWNVLSSHICSILHLCKLDTPSVLKVLTPQQ